MRHKLNILWKPRDYAVTRKRCEWTALSVSSSVVFPPVRSHVLYTWHYTHTTLLSRSIVTVYDDTHERVRKTVTECLTLLAGIRWTRQRSAMTRTCGLRWVGHVVCVCVRACVFMWFMRTHICIMTWVWQVLLGEGDLWGHFQCFLG